MEYICEATGKCHPCNVDEEGFGSCGDWNGDGECIWCREKKED